LRFLKKAAVVGLEEVEPDASTSSPPETPPEPQMWTKPLDFVLLAIPFAVLTGIGEFAVRWFIAFVLH
jgi:hypothetical protein